MRWCREPLTRAFRCQTLQEGDPALHEDDEGRSVEDADRLARCGRHGQAVGPHGAERYLKQTSTWWVPGATGKTYSPQGRTEGTPSMVTIVLNKRRRKANGKIFVRTLIAACPGCGGGGDDDGGGGGGGGAGGGAVVMRSPFVRAASWRRGAQPVPRGPTGTDRAGVSA